jgi:hypothetical protein
MESGDYQDTPLGKILHFVQSVGLLTGYNGRGDTQLINDGHCARTK